MKICIIGKIGSVTHWLEDCAAGLIAAGHVVQICPTRNPKLSATLERLLLARALGAPRAASIVKAVRQFIPDLVLAVKGFDMPRRNTRPAKIAAEPAAAGGLGR